MNAPSASSAASASILGRSAASTIGTGTVTGRSSRMPPIPRSAGTDSTGRSASVAHRIFASGRSNWSSLKRSTITFDDAPRPSTNRPALASCIAAAVWASTPGPRVNGLTTPVASRTRSVTGAAIASGVNPSVPFAVSPVQKSSYPAASARR